MIYHGVLRREQVAVKMLNRASVYDIQQFTKEVIIVSLKTNWVIHQLNVLLVYQVHDFVEVRHNNLVRLIGYCDEGEHLALIYEFVGNGNLQDHLSGI